MARYSHLLSLFSNPRGFMTAFFKTFPQHKSHKPKTQKVTPITDVIHKFNENFMDAVIDNRYGAELPLLMGKVMLIAYKPNRPYPNFVNYSVSKQTGIFTNFHTDGLVCRLRYTKWEARYRFKDKKMWTFVPTTGFKKKASKAFASDHKRYVVNYNVSKRFYDELDFKLKDVNDRKIEEYLKTYDELYIN